MPQQTVETNGLHFDREGEVTWRLREAAAPHRAFLNDALMDLLLKDGARGGGTANQILNVTRLPHTHRVANTPDTHHGYGSPIGTVYASPATLSLSVVGVDISCGMSVVATNLRRSDLGSIDERRQFGQYLRREVIPMGKGLARDNSDVVTDERDLIMRGMGGLKENIIRLLKLTRDSYEFEQDLSSTPMLWDAVPKRAMRGFGTLGSLGGGNHFIEFQSAEVLDAATAKAWGIEPDQLLIMIHSGSRKFGYEVAEHYMNSSQRQFAHRARADDIRDRLVQAARIERSRTERRDVPISDFHATIDDTAARIVIRYTAPDGDAITWNEDVPGSDLAPFFDPRFIDRAVGLPYALNPLPGTDIPGLPREAVELGQQYWIGVQASQNFAVLSRTIMLYRAAEELVRLFGHDRVQPRLLYDISHNNVQIEKVDGRPMFVHRKGATRAFPAGHEALAGTPWAATGHPITVPGSMGSYSYIMKALPTAEASLYSVNHGAGRAMSRGDARRTLDLAQQEAVLAALDNVVVGGTLDEMPAAYKDIDAVVETCRRGGLCQEVIRCVPALTIKGDDDGYD